MITELLMRGLSGLDNSGHFPEAPGPPAGLTSASPKGPLEHNIHFLFSLGTI